MEKILWSDGHTSLIDEKEAFAKTGVESTNDCDGVLVMVHDGFEFEWHNNMWMQR